MSDPERPLRVLYYNWVDYLDPERRGGGVTVYQRNLMARMAARTDIAPAFLSSGILYDLPRRGPRWERMRVGPAQDRDRRYAIVNSGTLAPGHHSFGHDAQITHPETEATFCDMVAATGPYDVVHFQNFEGIPVNVLAALKARFPDMALVVSLHNYYPICPQVNLWQREREHCDDFRDGRACVGCLLHQPNARLVVAAHGLSYRLQRMGMRPGSRAFNLSFGTAIRVGHRGSRLVGHLRRRRGGAALPAETASPKTAQIVPDVTPRGAEGFAARRPAMIDTLNAHADRVLGVSDRVCEIAARHGIAGAKLATSYIGTAEAARFAETAPRGPLPRADGTLHLAYLGYMRRDKGFFFLLDALEALPETLSRRLRLRVAARRGEPQAMARLDALGRRLAGVTHHDGYTHEGLDALLADVDLGIVPPLWEDNLPQVAIEMHARHVPLLTSDRGGAKELANCASMTFAAGDAESFRDRIEAILEGRIDMAAYWAGARAPQGMDGHLEELVSIYRGAVG
ncbi:glycosyltransferase [Palleronia sp. LCG004]|uniref:glycosyltransferase n=1 Tax=Palleronia sp. LCG004 TaxID=3079304 RepID=UPI002942029C|nr:glycosyltransferase [Palleronia sp. LCG004]WOI58364.1 glycosyltransferase [Palleronia sp. LCG004]